MGFELFLMSLTWSTVSLHACVRHGLIGGSKIFTLQDKLFIKSPQHSNSCENYKIRHTKISYTGYYLFDLLKYKKIWEVNDKSYHHYYYKVFIRPTAVFHIHQFENPNKTISEGMSKIEIGTDLD